MNKLSNTETAIIKKYFKAYGWTAVIADSHEGDLFLYDFRDFVTYEYNDSYADLPDTVEDALKYVSDYGKKAVSLKELYNTLLDDAYWAYVDDEDDWLSKHVTFTVITK